MNGVPFIISVSDTQDHTAGQPKPKGLHRKSGQKRRYSNVAFLAMAGLLCACEARLNLSGVEQTLNQPIRRTDQLMVLEQVG